ncbi:MAG: HAMP domain-containing histidine kinase [Acidobacteria bacterium]|nr:MAG: HAMP domain-containing histidine kinase [Acidobacteriota bacterium]
MGMEKPARHDARKRTVAMAVGVSLLLVLFVAGLAFANSIGAARVAENARSLHWANATLGTSSLTRAALVQAVTFVGLEQQGLVTDEDVAYATTQVVASYDELKQLEEIAGASPSSTDLTHFMAEVGSAMTALDEGSVDEARNIVIGDMEGAYIDLFDSLQTEQGTIQAAIEANTAAAARMNGYVVFILTLAIPGSAVIVYWWIARRQVREYRLRTELELEGQRAINRAKDSFIAGLSHELRTPLTSIYGFAEILTDGDGADPEQTKEIVQIIANEAAEMTRMVDDLLAASRMESSGIEVDMAPTNIREVVESAITPFERAGLEVKLSATDATVSTDAGRLRHILINLISNAARHGGDKIGVEVSLAGDTVDIEVWDNGQGVPEDKVEKLFDRFIHKDAAPLLTGSVGLGLAIASRLTTMLGGRLAYQRFAGKTYFIVNVPAAVAAQGDDAIESESVADVIQEMSG